MTLRDAKIFVRNLVAAFSAVVVLGACASIRTGSHYDETADFRAYQTFSWVSENPYVHDGSPELVSPLTQEKIRKAIQSALEGSGYKFTSDRDDADFIVAYTVGTREKIRVDSYPVSYPGSWGWHVYGSHYYVREVSAHSYTQGTLGVDIFDGKTHKPIWHGWAEKSISSSDRQDPGPVINEGVGKLFESFPR